MRNRSSVTASTFNVEIDISNVQHTPSNFILAVGKSFDDRDKFFESRLTLHQCGEFWIMKESFHSNTDARTQESCVY